MQNCVDKSAMVINFCCSIQGELVRDSVGCHSLDGATQRWNGRLLEMKNEKETHWRKRSLMDVVDSYF